jgi:amino acid permease
MSVFSSNALILVSMLSTAYVCHVNAPKFYWQLDDKSKFETVVWRSFGSAMGILAMFVLAGFLTFGANCDAIVLNNYSNADQLISMSRAAVAISLIVTTPLVFAGARDGVFDLMGIPESNRTQTSTDVMTVLLLAAITGMAWKLTDIGVILALCGATGSSLLVYVFPAIMMAGAAKKLEGNYDDSNNKKKKENIQENVLKALVPSATATGILGLILGIVGTVRALQ